MKNKGDKTVLEEPQIMAPPKQLWLLLRSPYGALPNTPKTVWPYMNHRYPILVLWDCEAEIIA